MEIDVEQKTTEIEQKVAELTTEIQKVQQGRQQFNQTSQQKESELVKSLLEEQGKLKLLKKLEGKKDGKGQDASDDAEGGGRTAAQN